MLPGTFDLATPDQMLPGTFDLATPDQRLAGFRINHLAEWYRRCGSHPLAVGLAMLHALRCLVGRLPCSERYAPPRGNKSPSVEKTHPKQAR